jgi:hypothetical protein
VFQQPAVPDDHHAIAHALDVAQEVRAHHDADPEVAPERADELENAGVTRSQALHQARREFGSSVRMRENTRAAWQVKWLEDLLSDLRYGLRALRRNPGFAGAATPGEAAHDEMRMVDGKPSFLTNRAGGTLGGISTGQDVVVRFAVKPTSSILISQRGVNQRGEDVEVVTKGRHDPCVGMRAVPVGEAMMAIVLADHLMRQRAQCG